MNDHRFQLDGTILVQYLGSGGEVIIPKGITQIGDYAFARNQTVTSVILPETVNHIGYGAFSNCTSLERVFFADGPTFFHNSIFEGCTSLRQVRLPDTITNTGRFLFKGCTALESVEMPAGLEELSEFTFHNCTALKKVYLGKKVCSIWYSSFDGCSALTELSVDPENNTFCVKDGTLLLSKGGKKVEKAMPSILGVFTVPDGVEEVGNFSFIGCSKLTGIRFAPSVKVIGTEAFRDCENLVSVVIPSTVKEVNFHAFFKNHWGMSASKPYEELIIDIDAGSVLACGIWLGPGSDPVCYPLLPFHFSNSKEDKQRLALGYILNYEKYTEEYAKGYLKYIKAQRKALLELARKQKIEGVEEFYAKLDAQPGAKSKKEDPASVLVTGTEQANPEEEFEIENGLLIHYLGAAETVVVPDNVVGIWEKAFCDCKKLKKVVFPQSVTYFSKKAFVKCPKLQTVVFYAPEPTLDFNFYKFRQGLDVVAPNASPALFPADCRTNSILSLAYEVWAERVPAPAPGGRLASYLKRTSNQIILLAEGAPAVLDLMLRLEVVTQKDAAHYLDACPGLEPAIRAKLINLTDKDKKGSAAVGLYLDEKPSTVAELKKDWTYTTIFFDASYTGTETIKGISLRKYKGISPHVEIPAFIGKMPVLHIGVGAFQNNSTIVSVKIPDTVFYIADYALCDCPKLEMVEHFGTKLYIGSGAFKNCSSLTTFTTTATEFHSGIHPFENCNKLFDAKGLIIPDIEENKLLVDVK